ncbi:MAG: alpha/beta fold hydrolase [Acidobacteriota bacterium]
MIGIRDSGFGIRAGTTAVLLAALAGAGSRPAAQEAQLVSFTAQDGVLVNGTLYLPERRPAPAVLLLHMLGRSRYDWDSIARALAEAGIAGLAIDLRRNAWPKPGTAGGGEGDFSDLILDAMAARAYVAARPEVASDRIGVAGASLGANVAALLAASDAAVRSLALLSPSLDYRGLRSDLALARYGSRPALLLASSEDPYAFRSARALVSAGAGQRELRVLSGAGHGTVMVARRPDLIPAIVDWFVYTLL